MKPIPASLMQVPIGWCADRFNLYWLYAGAFALWCVAQGLTGLAGSLAVLIGFRIVLGIGESVYLPGMIKIVSLLFARKERGLPSGFSSCGVRMGLGGTQIEGRDDGHPVNLAKAFRRRDAAWRPSTE